MFITERCVNCGICELECPNNAISSSDYIYEINNSKCTDCLGYYDTPACINVCPIKNAIINNKI